MFDQALRKNCTRSKFEAQMRKLCPKKQIIYRKAQAKTNNKYQ